MMININTQNFIMQEFLAIKSQILEEFIFLL